MLFVLFCFIIFFLICFLILVDLCLCVFLSYHFLLFVIIVHYFLHYYLLSNFMNKSILYFSILFLFYDVFFNFSFMYLFAFFVYVAIFCNCSLCFLIFGYFSIFWNPVDEGPSDEGPWAHKWVLEQTCTSLDDSTSDCYCSVGWNHKLVFVAWHFILLTRRHCWGMVRKSPWKCPAPKLRDDFDDQAPL